MKKIIVALVLFLMVVNTKTITNTYTNYLEGNYTNEELTQMVTDLQEEIATLKSSKAEKSSFNNVSDVINSSTLDKAYPVGSIYITYTEDTVAKVQTKFGGTWERIEDRFLLAAGSTYTVGNTGGSATNSHTHSVTVAGTVNGTALTTSQIPSHNHGLYGNAHAFSTVSSTSGVTQVVQMGIDSGIYWNGYWGLLSSSTTQASGGGGSHTHGFTGSTVTSGGSSNTNNMPPYLVVYIYKRVA